MFSSACVHVTRESWKLDLATFKRLVSCYEGGVTSTWCLFSLKKTFSFCLRFSQTMTLNLRRGRATPSWLQTGLFMLCVPVVGVWLIAGSQDVGGFRCYFITLTSPFLIKSRPTLSLRWVTSSICICILCVCVCLNAWCTLYALHLILLAWTTHVTFLQTLKTLYSFIELGT